MRLTRVRERATRLSRVVVLVMAQIGIGMWTLVVIVRMMRSKVVY